MSIISEALKKVEKQRSQTAGEKFSEKEKQQYIIPIVKEEKKKAINIFATKMVIAWLCGFVLIFVLILIFIPARSKRFINLSEDLSTQDLSVQSATEALSSVSPQLAKGGATFAPSKLKLSGIMLSENEPVAIINNKIVRKGDTIDGATVVSIDEQQARLAYLGEEFVLSIK